MREQRAELKAAGVDTRNLAAEQQRLGAEISGMSADAYRAQQEAARNQSEAERQALDEQRKIDQLELAAKRKKFSELAKLRDAEIKAAGMPTRHARTPSASHSMSWRRQSERSSIPRFATKRR